MNGLTSYQMAPEDFDILRSSLLKQKETISFKDEPKLASLVASVGIQREAGTLNDEMARFVFDPKTDAPIPFGDLRSELVQYHGAVGVRIWAPEYETLDLKFKGIRQLLHPRFSFREDGSVFQCVFFPENIAKILALQGADLVLVREWGMNTIFGGFDPSKHYYQTNFWELENNDTLRFAKLLENRQIPFLGTHDLVAHIAGVVDSAWEPLTKAARTVRETLQDYFSEIQRPTISSLVLPYTVGVLLDDLAQPPNYNSPGRHAVMTEALHAIRERRIDPRSPRVLMKFPGSYEKAIRLARDLDLSKIAMQTKPVIRDLVNEILTDSVLFQESMLNEDRTGLTAQARKEMNWS